MIDNTFNWSTITEKSKTDEEQMEITKKKTSGEKHLPIEERSLRGFLGLFFEENYFEENAIYFSNYITGSHLVFLKHVSNAYKNYIEKGNWTKTKLKAVIDHIVSKELVLSAHLFLKVGMDYDKGKLKKKEKKASFEERLTALYGEF